MNNEKETDEYENQEDSFYWYQEPVKVFCMLLTIAALAICVYGLERAIDIQVGYHLERVLENKLRLMKESEDELRLEMIRNAQEIERTQRVSESEVLQNELWQDTLKPRRKELNQQKEQREKRQRNYWKKYYGFD